MSFFDCIERALKDGQTDAERARATQEAWQEQADRYARFHDRRTAEELAYQDIRDAFRRDTAIKRHARLADLTVMRRNVAEVSATEDLAGAVTRPIERAEGAADQPDSVWFTAKALEQQFQGMMGNFFSAIHRNLLGNVTQKARLKNVVRELHGEGTGDAAASSMAKSIQKTFERARLLFNEAGGHVNALDDWGLPHTHDRRLVESAGRDAWISEVMPRLDWDRIENFMTGRPFGADAPQDVKVSFLSEVYDGITTSHLPQGAPRYGPTPGTGRLGDQYAHQRVLHFRDAENWMAYNDRFGAADVFASVTRHMQRMARDIAMMRAFGTNPRMGLEHRYQVALDVAKKRGLSSKETDAITRRMHRARAMLGQIDGSANTPVNEFWANFFSGIRMWTSASYLGGAVLSSGGDIAAMRLAARIVGMNPTNVVSRHVQLMASAQTRESAARLGYIADTLTDAGNTLARFLGEVPSNEILERVTSFTMRAQGLSHWTDMARTAFRMEMSGLFAENAGRALSDVTPELRKILEARGVTPEMWQAFARSDLLYDPGNGATFLSPSYWLERTDMPRAQAEEISIRMGSIIEEQVEMAVPTISIEGRAMIQGQAQPGTISGELMRSGLQFKSFALSVWMNQIRRLMAQPTGASRAIYGAEMLATFTLMGAVSLQLKEIAKGNDPRDMTSSNFWGAAALQGGGLGIVGDLLVSTTSRTGGGLGEYLMGPTVGFLNNVGQLTIGNAQQAILGEETNVGREASQFVRRNTPVLSTLWQTRAAMDRLLFDQIQIMLDPEATASMRRTAQNRLRNYGNATWWDDATAVPDRAPDLSAMFGN